LLRPSEELSEMIKLYLKIINISLALAKREKDREKEREKRKST